jgi:hypothetical protein
VRPFFDGEAACMLRRWAERIQVKQVGDKLLIVGTSSSHAAEKDLLRLFNRYQFAPNRELQEKGPHLEFANANSNHKLVAFTKTWGPIAAPSVLVQGWRKKNTLRYWGITDTPEVKENSESTQESKQAKELVSCVRAIQHVVLAILLLKIARTAEPARKTAFTAMRRMIKALVQVREEFSRTPASDEKYRDCALGSPGLLAECELIYKDAQDRRRRQNTSDLRNLCDDMLCALLNRFPDALVASTEGILSAPGSGHGVLPLLMFMLRLDVRAGRTIFVCSRCGEYVLERRRGEVACAGCKDAARSRRYYARKRKTILRRRKEKRRKAALEHRKNLR